MLKNILYLMTLLLLAGLVSLPGYLRSQKNIRRWDAKYEAAELARAKEAWAVSNRVALGEPVPGGIATLIAEDFLADEPARPVRGEWVLGLVGVPPRFVPEDPSQLEAEGSAIDWELSDYSSEDLKAKEAEWEANADARAEADERPADASTPDQASN